MKNPRKFGLSLSELHSNTLNTIKSDADTVTILSEGEVFCCSDSSRNFTSIQTRTYDNENTHNQKIRQFENFCYWISCDCQNFKNLWEPQLSIYGASGTKLPDIEVSYAHNPENKAGVCKHLYKILTNKKIMTSLDMRCDKTNLFNECKEMK